MIHSPYWTTDEAKLQGAWKSMEAVQRSGKAKSIGVSNYLRPHIEATLKIATIVPTVNQIEFHPYLQRGEDYVPWLQSQGIRVSGFKPLTPITAAAGGPLDAVVDKISKTHGVSIDSVLLRWQVQKEVIPITTTAKQSRLDEYWEATQFQLSGSEMDEITAVGLTHHFRNWGRNRFARMTGLERCSGQVKFHEGGDENLVGGNLSSLKLQIYEL
jgi:diketogulonate reductase-like aldo/keto reductase